LSLQIEITFRCYTVRLMYKGGPAITAVNEAE